MAGYTGFVRIIRRRLVLGLIFTLSLTYCAFSLFRNESRSIELDSDLDDMEGLIMNDNNNDDMISDDDVPSQQLKASGKPRESWGIDVPNEGGANDNGLGIDSPSNLNDSDTSNRPCRNSVQGKVLIVDEHGVVCARHELLSNGCCSREQKQPYKTEEATITALKERYSCKTCNAQGCCAIYEYCVSCCLHPAKHIKGKKDTVESGKNLPRIKEEDTVKVRLRNMDRFQTCLAACRTSSASVRHENTYKDPHSKHCYTLQPPYNHQRHRRDIKSLNNNRDNDGVVVTSSSVVQSITLDRANFLSCCHL
ncbi:UPF0454 protein C12orf49 homolog isoform X1 [Vespa mandarinia]|uniref:UPF0454 protein C12orf49 homolog isoform X1 n=1 Tax=Vespa mandarinia TaxID=7446 RepID=UPI0016151C57|nr:UPF0454 protein C12orf49 homolog isoform X1 [Vespa mandarinia]